MDDPSVSICRALGGGSVKALALHSSALGFSSLTLTELSQLKAGLRASDGQRWRVYPSVFRAPRRSSPKGGQ